MIILNFKLLIKRHIFKMNQSKYCIINLNVFHIKLLCQKKEKKRFTKSHKETLQ